MSGQKSQVNPLLTRLNSSLAWATTTVKCARLDSQFWCPDGDDSAIRPIDKMVLEASLLALVAGRCHDTRTAAEDLIQEVAKHTEVTSRIYNIVRWRPHLRTSLGLLWLAFDEFDCGDVNQRHAIRDLWESEPFPVQPHERIPYRLLDQAWVSSKVRGAIDPAIEKGALIPFTSLGNLDGAPFMHRNDLYALTHTAMYMTDFGEWLSHDVYSSEVINAISLSSLMDGDFDLAAELALADVLVGDVAVDVGQITVRAVLNDVFDAIGRIPSPTFKKSEYDLASDPDTYLRFHSYHTTFVYALLCYCILQKQSHQTNTFEPTLSAAKTRVWKSDEMDTMPHPIEDIGTLVAHHTQKWTAVCRARGASFDAEGDDLLRRVLDAHLIRAVNTDQIHNMVQLLGMSKVGGQSQVDKLVRTHVNQRARLAQASQGDTNLSEVVVSAFDEKNYLSHSQR